MYIITPCWYNVLQYNVSTDRKHVTTCICASTAAHSKIKTPFCEYYIKWLKVSTQNHVHQCVFKIKIITESIIANHNKSFSHVSFLSPCGINNILNTVAPV